MFNLENAYEIILDDTILLGAKNSFRINNMYNEGTMKVNCGILKKRPTEIIFFDGVEIDKELKKEINDKKIPVVDIKEIIRYQLTNILEEELRKFVEKNINNISYFFEDLEQSDSNNNKYYRTPDFLDPMYIGEDVLQEENKSIDSKVKNTLENVMYDEISNGIVKYGYFSCSKQSVKVNLYEKKIITPANEILTEMYSEKLLKNVLAYEQYKRGITPSFYNEIAKINEFLKGKKHVTVIMNDGTEGKAEADINDILYFYDGEISIRTYFLNVPNSDINNYKNINNLKCLRYGKNELNININNLKPLIEQLDELIETNKVEEKIEFGEQELEDE